VDDWETALFEAGVRREQMNDCPGIQCVRRKHETGHDYFVFNDSDHVVDEFFPLSVDFCDATIMDPMSGQIGRAQTRQDRENRVRLQLDPGASVILRIFSRKKSGALPWRYVQYEAPQHVLRGRWQVEFIEGGPELPASYETDNLSSWTEWCSGAARFAGTAVYRLCFDAPFKCEACLLDLGRVHSSARIHINGKYIGILIGPAYRIRLDNLKPTGNLLKVEVTNLAANRIRDLDRRGVAWKNFKDINFVSRGYKPFNAADWAVMDSGLLGPVTLLRQG
jgi:hypothetical protein